MIIRNKKKERDLRVPLTFLLSIFGRLALTADTGGMAGTVDNPGADCWCLVGGLATTTTGFWMEQEVTEAREVNAPAVGTALMAAVGIGEGVPIARVVVTVEGKFVSSTRLSIFNE